VSQPGPYPGRPPHDLARRLVAAAVADDLAAGGSLLHQLCHAAVRSLSVSGCVVHVVTGDGESGVAATSDERSNRVADLSFTTGDGPTLDAFTLRRPVLVSDLESERSRWPGFTESAVHREGIRAVFCFPLQVGGVNLGVLDLYSDRARTLDDAETALALAFTHLAALTILGDNQIGVDGRWEPLLDHRAEIHQAQGMVMVDLTVDLGEALVRMRAHAFSEGLPLIEVARAIIAGFVLPAATAGETPS